MGEEISEIEFARQQQQQQIANDPQAMYANDMREEKTTNILSQINPDNLLEDIEHRIRGEKKDKLSGEWKSINQEKSQISEGLVSDFMSFLGSILNQNTSMSNFSSMEINNLMEVIIDWVKRHLVINAETYGIEGQYSEYDRIAHIICATCFAVFKRALNGQESRRVFRIMRLTESNNQTKGKGGFADNFKFW